MGKDGMKTMKYNNEIGATSGCTLRMMEDTVGEDTPFYGILGVAWFGSTGAFSEAAKVAFEEIFQIKQYAAFLVAYMPQMKNSAPTT